MLEIYKSTSSPNTTIHHIYHKSMLDTFRCSIRFLTYESYDTLVISSSIYYSSGYLVFEIELNDFYYKVLPSKSCFQ